MAFDPSLDAKQRIREAIDIVELAGGYLQLRREGRAYKALCPWHDDTRPSLTINPERQSFKCWVCDLGGDVFSFLMKIENVDFPTALEMLAEKAGISLQRTPGAAAAQDDKRLWYRVAAWAENEFHRCLTADPIAEGARKYLDERGITAESIATFHLGFSPPSWDWLIERARSANMSARVLETVGLALPRQSGGGHYDRFRGRVLFSIRDAQGRPVGFGGRLLPGSKDEGAKYINSPETPLFKKSELLYGLEAARTAMGKSRSALIMEGYTDCVVAHQFGFGSAVAVLGTAVGERHLRLLQRFGVERLILVLDGDEAGRRRTDEVLGLFVAEQVDVRVLTLPDGLDPCEFLRERGAAAFALLIERAPDALEHKFMTSTADLGAQAGTHALHAAMEEVLATLAVAPRLQGGGNSSARLREEQILGRLSHRFGVHEERLRARLSEIRRGAKRTLPSPSATPTDARCNLEPWQRELLELLLLRPEALLEMQPLVRVEALSPGAGRDIYIACCRLAEDGRAPAVERLLLEFDDPAVKSLIVDLDESGRAKSTVDSDARLISWKQQFEHRAADLAVGQHARTLREGLLGDDQEQRLLQQLIERKRNRQGISTPMDG